MYLLRDGQSPKNVSVRGNKYCVTNWTWKLVCVLDCCMEGVKH